MWILLVQACLTDAETLPVDAASLPQAMSLTVTSPMVPGMPVGFAIRGAAPHTPVTLVSSLGRLGAGGCPPLLGGECLDITPGPGGYGVVSTVMTDAAGEAILRRTVPAMPVGTNIAFQAVDAAAVLGSNPLVVPVAARGSCWEDLQEPNDDCNHPGMLQLGPQHDLTICDYDPADWYEVTLDAGQTLTVDLSYDAADGDVDLFLIDPSLFWPISNDVGDLLFGQVAAAIQAGGRDHLRFTAPTPRTYYLVATVAYISASPPIRMGASYSIDAQIR